MTRAACTLALALALTAGCGDHRRPPGLTQLTVTGAAADERARTRLGTVAREWDARRNPAQVVTVEVRPAHPQTVPPACYGCDPGFVLNNGSLAAAATYPSGAVVVAQGSEWALYHELLHVQQLRDGWDADPTTPQWDPDVHHKDPRWAAVDAVARALQVQLQASGP